MCNVNSSVLASIDARVLQAVILLLLFSVNTQPAYFGQGTKLTVLGKLTLYLFYLILFYFSYVVALRQFNQNKKKTFW